MSPDSGFDNGSLKPIIMERVASPGEFVRKLEASPFSQSRILRNAASYIESGRFAEGTDAVLAELVERGVRIEYVPRGASRRGTRVESGRETMILDDDFKDQPPAKKLWSLLHGDMSLILQRAGKREDPHSMRELLEMDIAYAEAVRLGATRVTDALGRASARNTANDIEFMANQKIITFRRPVVRKRII